MSGIMAALGATLAFLTVPPEWGTLAMIGWILGAAVVGFLHVELFRDFRRRRYAIGLLGSPWGDKQRHRLALAASAVAGYIAGAVRYPDHPDYAFLSAWCAALGGAFIVLVLQQQAEKPVQDRYDDRRLMRLKLFDEAADFANYLSSMLGRRGLSLVCSGEGFDAADYRWWAANDTDYGFDTLIAANWRIKYDAGDTVRIEFAGRSEEIRPRSLEKPEYFQGVRLGPEPPSEYELAERLHQFLEVRRSWEIPTTPGGGEPDLGALATIIAIMPADAQSP